ncbi:MAG: ROK family transcriptional regulator [Acidobacteriota bacterium]
MKKKNIPLGRPSVLRHTNAHSILKLLRDFGSCSRADLVRASGLSAPTVTNVVKDLLKKGLVEPLGEGESSGGRPPDMIRFHAEQGCLLAVQLSSTRLSFLLTDLNGIELESRKLSLADCSTIPAAICGYIERELKVLLRKQKKTRNQLLAIVVAVPAITNVDEGTVLAISTLEDWRSVPLRDMLSRVVHCSVMLENDMNLAAQGEQFCGAAQSEKDFVLIDIGENVGAGIFLDGRIHHGSQWSAGEIGYLRLPGTSRRQPTIHEFGELELVLTSSGILRSWCESGEKRAKGEKRPPEAINALEVLDLAQVGDARARKIVRERAEIVADIIVDLSLILNPNLILLGGEIGGHPALIEAVGQQLQGSEFAVPRIGAGTPGNRAALWGAIAVALDAIPSVLLPEPPM